MAVEGERKTSKPKQLVEPWGTGHGWRPVRKETGKVRRGQV